MWKHSTYYWPFVWEIQGLLVDSLSKPVMVTVLFPLMLIWIANQKQPCGRRFETPRRDVTVLIKVLRGMWINGMLSSLIYILLDSDILAVPWSEIKYWTASAYVHKLGCAQSVMHSSENYICVTCHCMAIDPSSNIFRDTQLSVMVVVTCWCPDSLNSWATVNPVITLCHFSIDRY